MHLERAEDAGQRVSVKDSERVYSSCGVDRRKKNVESLSIEIAEEGDFAQRCLCQSYLVLFAKDI